MVGLFQRINFFKGLFMKEQDWQKEQEYHMEKQRFHNKYLHIPGIVFNCREELRVSVSDTGDKLNVAPGYAIDGEGRDLYVPEAKEITIPDLLSFNPPTTIYISLRYTENFHDRRENAANPMYSGYGCVSEDTIMEITAEKPDNYTCIELGRVRLSENPIRIRNAVSQPEPGKAVLPAPIKGGRRGAGKAVLPSSVKGGQPGARKAVVPASAKVGLQRVETAGFPGAETAESAGLDELDLSQVPEAGALLSTRKKPLTISDLGEKLIDTRLVVIAGNRKQEDTNILIEQYPKHVTPPMYIVSVQSLDGVRTRWSIECTENEVGTLDYSLHIRNESNRSTTVACRVFRVRI